MAKRRKIKNHGPVFVLMIITLLISVLSLGLSLVEFQASKSIIANGTLETALVSVNNIISIDGIKYLFSNITNNFQMFQPLVLIIISLIGIGICEKSGLLYSIFSPIKKLKFSIIIFLTLLIGITSTVIGDFSYIFLIPLVGVIYKYMDKNPILGILITFVGITIGFGTGLIFNYSDHLLGLLTESSATLSVDPNYAYSLFSYIYIMIFSTIVLSYIGTMVIEKLLVPKFTKKYSYETDVIISKKAKKVTLLLFLILLGLLTYFVLPINLPFAGMLLDVDSTRYMDKLFGANSPFGNGLVFIISGIMTLCGFVYGKISKNIKDGHDFSLALSKNFENLGFMFVLMFFISQIIAIIDWTNLGVVISCKLVEIMGTLQMSGILLIIVFIIFTIIMSILIPSTLIKWEILSPTIVPLFMRSNISPGFTQFLFKMSDGIGKSLNPIYPYFIIMIAFLEKYRVDEKYRVSIFGTYKMLLPIILIMSFTFILIVMLWYLLGFPIGIGISANL